MPFRTTRRIAARWTAWPLSGHVKTLLAGSLACLAAGAALGTAMAVHDAWIGAEAGGWTDEFRLAHTHLLLAGWASLMIYGVGYHMLPHLLGGPLWSRAAARLHAALAVGGVPVLAYGLWRSRVTDGAGWPAVEAGGAALLVGALLFAWNLFATARAARAWPGAPTLTVKIFLAAALTSLVLGLALGLHVAVADAADPLEEAGIYWRPVHAHLLLIGFLTFMIFGVGYHLLPRFAGATIRWPRLARAHAWLAIAGLTLMVAGFALSRAEAGPAWSRWLLAAGGFAQYAGFWMFALNVGISLRGGTGLPGHLRLLLLAPLAFLLLGGSWGFEMVLADALDHARGGRVVFVDVPAHAHALTFGWATLMIFGVGYQILPRFSGSAIRSDRAARVQAAAAVGGVAALAASFWLNRAREGAWAGAVAVAGLVALAAVLGFVWLLAGAFWRAGRNAA